MLAHVIIVSGPLVHDFTSLGYDFSGSLPPPPLPSMISQVFSSQPCCNFPTMSQYCADIVNGACDGSDVHVIIRDWLQASQTEFPFLLGNVYAEMLWWMALPAISG